MKPLRIALVALSVLGLAAQDMPREYQDALNTLGKQGDFKDNVLKVNIPRNDVKVVVDGVATPTPFGFGGWLALSKGSGGMNVMMGDLVLLQDEVNPVMSALLDRGLEVTAVHNHFFFDQPHMFYMHVMGHGTPADLAKNVKPAVDLIGHGKVAHPETPGLASLQPGTIDTSKLAQIVGHMGEQSGSVYKITVGRDDLKLTEMGAPINARMGLNTWAAFVGSDQNAAIAGDFAMLDSEVQLVLKALRAHDLQVVAIHNHMIGTRPNIRIPALLGQGSGR